MKKLRLFDSLKLVLATVACIFILNVAHADTTAIQSVIAYGKTEQNGTPTPDAPVDIVSNNGAIKVSPNLFNKDLVPNENKYIIASRGTANTPSSSEFRHSDYITIKGNTQYYVGIVVSPANAAGLAFYDDTKTYISGLSLTQLGDANNIITSPNNAKYIRFSFKIDGGYNTDWENTVYFVEGNQPLADGQIYYGGIVANGLTETIRDAAGHKATTQMLLSVGDYKDEQNITTGAITRRVGVKVLDGTEDWQLNNVSVHNVKDAMVIPLSLIAPDAKNNLSTAEQFAVKCTHLVRRGVSAFNGDVSGFDWATRWFDSTPRVAIRVAGITTVAQFKSWLAEQYANGTPVVVVYPLETETTESVATQTLTTAPVRQTLGAIMDMPIKTILTDNTEIMSGANELIKIATTKYNEESFEDVQDALTGVFNAVDTVVTQTMSQAQAIDQIANEKQTRPDETCPVGKNCLLVEDEQGVPHWYVIAGANDVEYNLPSGYTQLTYIQSDGSQMINTGYVLQETDSVEVDYKLTDLTRTGDKFILGAQPVSGAPGGFWVETYNDTNDWYVRYGSGTSANTYGSVTPTSQLSGTLAVSKNSFVVNGVKILTPDFVSMPANPMTIFNRIALDGSIVNGASAQISEVRVKNGNNLVHRYIPVRNSNNELGMYDLMDSNPATAFYTNAGTGTFTAGSEM